MKWSFTAGWRSGCEEGGANPRPAYSRETVGWSLGARHQECTAVAGGLFPKGGGWAGLKYVFRFPEWDGSIFPLPSVTFLWVRTGKLNMSSCCVCVGIKSSHSDLFCSLFFTWDGGGCLLQGFKNASHACLGFCFVVLFLFFQMTDRTQTWADGCPALVSVLEVTEMPRHVSRAAVVVVLVLVLDLVVPLGPSSCCFLRTKWILFPGAPAA